jgi:hypothetical protein
MSTPLLNPEFFDDPRLNCVRRCWKAHGSKKVNGPHQKTKTRDTVIYVNASRETVARRVARRELSLRNYKLDHVHEISWNEYARCLPREYVSHVQTAAAGHRPAARDSISLLSPPASKPSA